MKKKIRDCTQFCAIMMVGGIQRVVPPGSWHFCRGQWAAFTLRMYGRKRPEENEFDQERVTKIRKQDSTANSSKSVRIKRNLWKRTEGLSEKRVTRGEGRFIDSQVWLTESVSTRIYASLFLDVGSWGRIEAEMWRRTIFYFQSLH